MLDPLFPNTKKPRHEACGGSLREGRSFAPKSHHAVRDLDPSIIEMARWYVRPETRAYIADLFQEVMSIGEPKRPNAKGETAYGILEENGLLSHFGLD